VLNRPTEKSIRDISAQLTLEVTDWDKPIHLGGPVPGPLIAIHTDPTLADDEILPGLFTAVDPEKLREIVLRKAEPSFIVAHYSGWGPGQLEAEFAEDSWLTLPARQEHIFRTDARELWGAVMREIGDTRLNEMLKLRARPDDPNVN